MEMRTLPQLWWLLHRSHSHSKFELIHVIHAFNLHWNGHIIALYMPQPTTKAIFPILSVSLVSIIHSSILSFVCCWPLSYFCSVPPVCLSFRFNNWSLLLALQSVMFKIEFHTLWIKFIFHGFCWFEWNEHDFINKILCDRKKNI